MKIAVTTENGEIFQHFGQCKTFTIFSAENGEITNKVLLDAGDSGHSALAGLLSGNYIDAVICGGIGGGAKQMLAASGIQLISGVSGSVDAAAEAFVKGTLKDQGATCNHHDHDCAEHDHHHGDDHGHQHGHDSSHGQGCSCGSHCH